jgi:hypothetical protein
MGLSPERYSARKKTGRVKAIRNAGKAKNPGISSLQLRIQPVESTR